MNLQHFVSFSWEMKIPFHPASVLSDYFDRMSQKPADRFQWHVVEQQVLG